MERVLTTAQMREADSYTINKLGIPSEVLIERAANAILEVILDNYKGGRVLVCIGKGNNGEDGKHLSVLLSKIHGFNVVNFFAEMDDLSIFDKKFDIIIDCLFGTGLNRQLDDKYLQILKRINDSNSKIISCDIPSGINGDNGLVMGGAVKADITVAIQDYKLGHFLNDGVDYCGKIILKDIGISVWSEGHVKKMRLEDLKPFFLDRKRNVNKGSFGKACIFGGSKAYSGSVILSISAILALKMGLGYVNLAIPNSLYSVYAGRYPEITYTCVNDLDGNIIFDKKSIDKILKYDCIAFGMGVGVSEGVYDTLKYLLSNYYGVLIIDADGINTLSKYGAEILKNKVCKVVLTPHFKEFERLADIKVEKIKENSVEIAENFAKEYQVVLLLKNSTSIITDGTLSIINSTGCSGMAKGGSGDTLTGICAGMCANNNELLTAVGASAYVFGKAGEFAQKLQNSYTLTPSDVVKVLPSVINAIID